MAKAFLFDMNGTMIDDMAFHTKVWHDILTNDLQVNMTLEDTKKHMYGKNEELFERLFEKGRFTNEQVQEISMQKEMKYQEMYHPHLKLIDGLQEFLDQARMQDIGLAIGTAAMPFNVNFVLDNIPVKEYFTSIITANDVTASKPAPEVFLKCADAMQVPYHNCIVFEDAPKGIEAALNAGMKAVALTTHYAAADFSGYPNVLMCVADYTDLRLQELF